MKACARSSQGKCLQPRPAGILFCVKVLCHLLILFCSLHCSTSQPGWARKGTLGIRTSTPSAENSQSLCLASSCFRGDFQQVSSYAVSTPLPNLLLCKSGLGPWGVYIFHGELSQVPLVVLCPPRTGFSLSAPLLGSSCFPHICPHCPDITAFYMALPTPQFAQALGGFRFNSFFFF